MARLALVVGNNYSGSQNALRGCVNDAKSVQAFLTKNGFSINALYDQNAIKHAVVYAIKSLAGRAVAGDDVFVYFSGHGGSIPDQNGDEEDGRDETYLCHDSLVPSRNPSKDLVDDELHALSCLFKADVRVLFVSDSCHSGTVLDLPLSYRLSGTSLQYTTNGRVSSPAAKVILISGCQDNQYSMESFIDGKVCGVMTSHLIKIASPALPMSTIYRNLVASITRDGYDQIPLLSTSKGVNVDASWLGTNISRPSEAIVVPEAKKRKLMRKRVNGRIVVVHA